MPPSTAMDCAVMWLARSESRKQASFREFLGGADAAHGHALAQQVADRLRRCVRIELHQHRRLDQARAARS